MGGETRIGRRGEIDDNKSTQGRAFRSAVMHTEDQADSSSSINTEERSVVEETDRKI